MGTRANAEHADAIARGEQLALVHSSSAFIEKASGIKRRHVIDKEGILDPTRMKPNIPDRANDQPSVQCDMAVAACREALQQAGKTADDVDAVIVACSNMQRAYPAPFSFKPFRRLWQGRAERLVKGRNRGCCDQTTPALRILPRRVVRCLRLLSHGRCRGWCCRPCRRR